MSRSGGLLPEDRAALLKAQKDREETIKRQQELARQQRQAQSEAIQKAMKQAEFTPKPISEYKKFLTEKQLTELRSVIRKQPTRQLSEQQKQELQSIVTVPQAKLSIEAAETAVKQAEGMAESWGSKIQWGDKEFNLGTTQGYKDFKQQLREAKSDINEARNTLKLYESADWEQRSTRKAKKAVEKARKVIEDAGKIVEEQEEQQEKLSEAEKKLSRARHPTALNILEPIASTVAKAGEDYERAFKSALKPLDDAIERTHADAVGRAIGNDMPGAVGLYLLSTGGRAVRGAVNTVTFPIRPGLWAETLDAVSMILRPEENETPAEYRRRVKEIVEGDLDDPKLAAKYTDQLAASLPRFTYSDEQLIQGKAFREAVAAEILSNPLGFAAEVAGGAVGGYYMGKAISKLPGALRKITPKSLEQRAFEKLMPLESAEKSFSGITPKIGESGALLMPRGKWMRSTWAIAKSSTHRGSTTIIMLFDPATKLVKGVLTWKDAEAMTGGFPEALSTIGGLQAIPVLKVDQHVSGQDLVTLQSLRLMPVTEVYSPLEKQRDDEYIIMSSLSLSSLTQIRAQLSEQIQSLKQYQQQLQELSQVQGLSGEQRHAIKLRLNQVQNSIQSLEDVQAQAPAQTPVQSQAQVEAQVQEAVQIQEPKPKQPFIPLREKEEEAKRGPRASATGTLGKYRVKFSFSSGSSQSLSVEASSYPEALNRAQRLRRSSREPPYAADIWRLE